MPSANDIDRAPQAAHRRGARAPRSASPVRALCNAIWCALALTALAPLGGCGGSKPPPASPCSLPVTIDVTASERLNPDENAQSLPTVVRVLQLTHAARVEEADFVQLWERLEDTLGDQLVQKQELTVFPGKREPLAIELDPKSRFLVGMAVFRQPTGTQWRSIVPLPASEKLCAAYKVKAPKPAVDFTLDGYRIEARSHLLHDSDQVDLPTDITAGSEHPSEQPER
jgi:type VI secretion system protein VasD